MTNQYINPAKNDQWGTPQRLFDQLNQEFKFTLDACATEKTAKCKKYLTTQEDALLQEWDTKTFCNPPYGQPLLNWISKAYAESKKGKIVVMLLPARTDTEWFHRFCLQPSVEIRWIKGRICFNDAKGKAPFPSMIVIFWGEKS
jgi:phage N-6-adenine-methyltransferase